MTSEELIALLLSEEGMRHTQSRLCPNTPHPIVATAYATVVSLLRSFNEDIKEQPLISISNTITDRRPVEMTQCEQLDDVDFVVATLAVIYTKGENSAQLFFKGASTGNSTPFDVYTFARIPDSNEFYMKSANQINFKLLNGEAFSPDGRVVFLISEVGNPMINSSAKYPRLHGISGECKQQLAPIDVVIDNKGFNNE